MSLFEEVEYKYNAKNIPIDKFITNVLNSGFNVSKVEEIVYDPSSGCESFDYYFCRDSDNRFMRFRNGKTGGKYFWELTSKIKTSENNNNVRSEVNITLSPKTTFEQIALLAAHHGCRFDFAIAKKGIIYWVDDVVLSYYDVLDSGGTKIDTFIEIEADESRAWGYTGDAIRKINEWEKRLSHLTAPKRIKRSLFEMYSGKLETPLILEGKLLTARVEEFL